MSVSPGFLLCKYRIAVLKFVPSVVTVGLAQGLAVVELAYSFTDGKISSSDLCGDLGKLVRAVVHSVFPSFKEDGSVSLSSSK